MIPPLQPLRLRSITRWMQDKNKHREPGTPVPYPPEEIPQLALDKDEAMMEAFDQEMTALESRVLDSKTPQGYQEQVQALNTGKMMAWQETVNDFLAPITYLDLED